MRLKVDLESDALYFRISEDEIESSEEIKPGIVVDYTKSGKVAGVEVLNLKKQFSIKDLSSIKVDLPTRA